jgi:hypothetical protein
MKTYSVTLEKNGKYWVNNWDKWHSIDDIDWDKVAQYCEENSTITAFGYMYGTDSRNLTSSRCRTVLWERLKIRPEVAASLRKSIEENAEVWAKLAGT